MTDDYKRDIAEVVQAEESRVDGLIVSNTTVSRPEQLLSCNKEETGGLSGQPVKEAATQTIRDMYQLTGGQVPIIGVGGVGSGQDAYEKVAAGASLVQLYTAMVYQGPTVVYRVRRELGQILEEKGFERLEQAVGSENMRKTKDKEQ